MKKNLWIGITGVLFLVMMAVSPVEAGLIMSLSPDSQTVNVGDTFTLDMVLDNAGAVPFMGLMAWVVYDPSYLEVIDPGEDGSWITAPDPNIADAAYHAVFPFGWDIKNDAYSVTGEIDYQESVNIGAPLLTGSGVYATITFRAKTEIQSTEISYRTNGVPTKNTYVSDEWGDNLLTGVMPATVTVVPEPGTVLLLSAGLWSLAGYKRRCRDKKIIMEGERW